MLKRSSSSRWTAVVAVVMGACCSSSLWAQEKAVVPLLPTDDAQRLNSLPFFSEGRFQRLAPGETGSFAIPIRNVKASLVAYWLDPAHHPAPPQWQFSLAGTFENSLLQGIPRLPGNANGPVGLKLPAGISSLVAIDPQNSLLVTGTKEGIEALRTLLPTIDVPLVQYEIEARFLQIPRSALPATGLKFDRHTEESPYSFGSVAAVPASFDVRELVELLKKGGKILTAPRVTTIDGLTGQLQQTTTTPFLTDADLAKQYAQPASKPTLQARPGEIVPTLTGATPGVAFLTNVIGIRTTALQGKGNLVTVAITPMLGTRSVSVTTTVRDGQSFAIQMSPPKEAIQVVVVVTPRRIRRVGDDGNDDVVAIPIGGAAK